MQTFLYLTLLLCLQSSLTETHQKRRKKRLRSQFEEKSENDMDAYGREVYRGSEHPELRIPPPKEEETEFVRTEYQDKNVYKKVRTYSSAPRQIECYSCMSLSYQTSWKYLQSTYIYPKVFTDRCRDPGVERGMPTVICTSVCISLLEPEIEAGVFIGYKHIRGCLDHVLRHGFNQSALRTHRFHQNNQCRTLSRGHLFNPAKSTDPPAIGDVQLCSCYGDRCNSVKKEQNIWIVTIIALFIVLR